MENLQHRECRRTIKPRMLITCKKTNKEKNNHSNSHLPFPSPSIGKSLVVFCFQLLMVLFHQARVSSLSFSSQCFLFVHLLWFQTPKPLMITSGLNFIFLEIGGIENLTNFSTKKGKLVELTLGKNSIILQNFLKN
jgi:hypothetical protein